MKRWKVTRGAFFPGFRGLARGEGIVGMRVRPERDRADKMRRTGHARPGPWLRRARQAPSCRSAWRQRAGGKVGANAPSRTLPASAVGASVGANAPRRTLAASVVGASVGANAPRRTLAASVVGASVGANAPRRTLAASAVGASVGRRRRDGPWRRRRSAPASGRMRRGEPCRHRRWAPASGRMRRDGPWWHRRSAPASGRMRPDEPWRRRQSVPVSGRMRPGGLCRYRSRWRRKQRWRYSFVGTLPLRCERVQFLARERPFGPRWRGRNVSTLRIFYRCFDVTLPSNR